MEKPDDSTLLNICVFPDERVSEECIRLSQSLKSEQTMFVLGDGLFPHMTAYMARFANDQINIVIEATKIALKQAVSFKCEHTGYFMTEGRYLEASYRKSTEFMHLHELLITHIASLRINPGSPFSESYFAPYTAEQENNAQGTGYDLARNLYRPHISLTRYHQDRIPTEFPAFPSVNLSFNLKKVSLYKADDNGAVYELVKEFLVA